MLCKFLRYILAETNNRKGPSNWRIDLSHLISLERLASGHQAGDALRACDKDRPTAAVTVREDLDHAATLLQAVGLAYLAVLPLKLRNDVFALAARHLRLR